MATAEVRIACSIDVHEVTMPDGREALIVEAYGLGGRFDETYVLHPDGGMACLR